MKKLIVIVHFIFIAICSQAHEKDSSISIIPEPVQITRNAGYFVLPHNITINTVELTDLKHTLVFLQEKLSTSTGAHVTLNNNDENATIKIWLNKTPDNILGDEGYKLAVATNQISIWANKPAGIFYGVQTLMQLFPVEIESKEQVRNVEWMLPTVDIVDFPRFGWRGLMFDVSRHFFTKQEVMDYIDQMARYKFNLFHWHLTDDEGWRIQINSLPKLTEVGAWNVYKVGSFGSFTPPTPNEPRDYGGFYTQNDIKEVVQYAKERFINILPEVDVPGHSLAAIVSYPDLSCTAGSDKYKVRSGESIMDWHSNGTFTAKIDNTLCPANEKVYTFLDKVFTEVAELFPFEYIHAGGDEAPKNFWEKSDQVKALMKKENLKDMHEVQSYFTSRVEKIINSKGKKLIGWDEILEGGLAPNAAVMSWRGMKGGIEAARLGHEVVMSPTTFVYLDYMQGDKIVEPHVYASLRLNKTYQFEPVPEGVDPKLIKGGQGNLWTEQVYNKRQAEYMTWPRAFAIAESVWSPKEKKNWNTFIGKVEDHFSRFNLQEVKYSPSMYDPDFKAVKNGSGNMQIELSTEVDGLDIYYTFDNSFPDNYYPKYSAPLTPPKDATTLKVITYKGKKPVGRIISMPLDEMKKRLN